MFISIPFSDQWRRAILSSSIRLFALRCMETPFALKIGPFRFAVIFPSVSFTASIRTSRNYKSATLCLRSNAPKKSSGAGFGARRKSALLYFSENPFISILSATSDLRPKEPMNENFAAIWGTSMKKPLEPWFGVKRISFARMRKGLIE